MRNKLRYFRFGSFGRTNLLSFMIWVFMGQALVAGGPAVQLLIDAAQDPQVGENLEMRLTIDSHIKSSAQFRLQLSIPPSVDLVSATNDLSGIIFGETKKTVVIGVVPKQLGDFLIRARLEFQAEGASAPTLVENTAALRLRSTKERSTVFVDQKAWSRSHLADQIEEGKRAWTNLSADERDQRVSALQGSPVPRRDSDYRVPRSTRDAQQLYLEALLKTDFGVASNAEQRKFKESFLGATTRKHIGSRERNPLTDGLVHRREPVTFIYTKELALRAGELYTFETRNLAPGSDTVAYLFFYDENTGQTTQVAWNDDADETTLGSKIYYKAEQGGLYTLVVRSYNQETRGVCDIYINDRFVEQTPFAGAAYKITSDQGDTLWTVGLTRTPNRADTVMFIRSDNDPQVLWDDDGGMELGSKLTLPGLSSVELVLGAYSKASEGQCDIILNTADGSFGAHARGDRDGDGLSNELESALGTNPDSEDTDNDGLLDSWEVLGVQDTDYAALGADPTIPDIFVQADWMASTHNHEPNPAAMQMIRDSFATEGITLHVDAGDVSEGGQGHLLPAPWTHLDFINLGPTFRAIKEANFDQEKRGALWHYTIFAHRQGPPPNCSSGVAIINGGDFLVTLGCASGQVGTVNDQAGTFMHELGHNLSLRHGGFENLNYKPNYRSVMNYLFQIRGTCGTLGFNNGVTFAPCVPREFFYSHGIGDDLDENCLDETIGIGKGPIDWNMDGQFDTCVRADINYPFFGRPDGRFDLLRDYDDYLNLRIRMAGFANEPPVREEMVTCSPPLDPE